jgi:hypothetical protein
VAAQGEARRGQGWGAVRPRGDSGTSKPGGARGGASKSGALHASRAPRLETGREQG